MIEMWKQYRTRDGREVRLLCTDAPGKYPVVALIDMGDDFSPERFTSKGEEYYGVEGNLDLIEVKQKIVRWANVYRGDFFPTKESAHVHAMSNRIACIRIEFEEGEGL